MATIWDEGLYRLYQQPVIAAVEENDAEETYLKMLEDCEFPQDEEDEHMFN